MPQAALAADLPAGAGQAVSHLATDHRQRYRGGQYGPTQLSERDTDRTRRTA